MNQNIAYFPQTNIDHRQANNGQNLPFHEFPTGFHTSNATSFHTNSTTFVANSGQNQHTLSQNATSIPNQRITTTAVPVSVSSGQQQQPATVHVQLVPQGNSPVTSQQHIIIAAQPLSQNSTQGGGGTEPEDRRMAAFMEYFVEQQQPVCSTVQQNSNIQYQSPTMNAKYAIKNKLNSSVDKSERDLVKRAKQAEAARQRYHRLTPDEKKDLNLKRTLAQKRKRQREKELSELEQILRMTNDIVDDPEVTEQLREKRMRARWAEAARTRYQRMSSEERRQHNTKRRMRQTKGEKGVEGDDDATRMRIREQNVKKAEAARLRYHRMSLEEKKLYNQRRTEAFRRRRMEEEALLAMPIGRINGEALDRAQQIVVRNAKRAEAARLRYQRMTPEQRKLYNQKRYTPKRKREPASSDGSMTETPTGERPVKVKQQHEFDALSSLERDVIRRTQQAQQSLLRQRQQQGSQPGQMVGTPSGGVPVSGASPYNNTSGGIIGGLGGIGVGQTLGNALAAQQNQIQQQQIQQQQQQQQQQQSHTPLGTLQLGTSIAGTVRHQIQHGSSAGGQQQHPIQLQYTTGGMIQHIQQQQTQQPQQQSQLITTYATQQHPN